MVAKALFSSATDEWSTPQDLFDKLNEEFKFTIDVCATPENAKCPRYFTKRDDGFKQGWVNEVAWCNPPYSQLRSWLEKAAAQTRNGTTTVLLIPSRTDTRAWHACVQPILDGQVPGEVRFIKGRLKFGGSKNSAPFPSAVVVMRPR